MKKTVFQLSGTNMLVDIIQALIWPKIALLLLQLQSSILFLVGIGDFISLRSFNYYKRIYLYTFLVFCNVFCLFPILFFIRLLKVILPF